MQYPVYKDQGAIFLKFKTHFTSGFNNAGYLGLVANSDFHAECFPKVLKTGSQNLVSKHNVDFF